MSDKEKSKHHDSVTIATGRSVSISKGVTISWSSSEIDAEGRLVSTGSTTSRSVSIGESTSIREEESSDE